VIKVIKKGISEEAAAGMDAKVKATVESILEDIDVRGDAAVRELSEKFDNWSPESFRLSNDEIRAAMARLPEQTIDDIKFAQAQIRKFAEIQLASLHDVSTVLVATFRAASTRWLRALI
jgi:sulfopropanediol 3-dehydrogenase